MTFCYSINDKHASKFLSFLALGVLTALGKNLISVDEAEGYIFKPYIPRLLEGIGSPEELLEIINLGCELEDVETLYPENLHAEIERLISKTLSVISRSADFGRLVEKEIKIIND
ncbi:DUF3969 family protein [Proteus hauseri]|uniref:DUF3969 family protein n=1 Tax=Proteus hauseri TaxID=183417 RepID=UPI0032DBF2C6